MIEIRFLVHFYGITPTTGSSMRSRSGTLTRENSAGFSDTQSRSRSNTLTNDDVDDDGRRFDNVHMLFGSV